MALSLTRLAARPGATRRLAFMEPGLSSANTFDAAVQPSGAGDLRALYEKVKRQAAHAD